MAMQGLWNETQRNPLGATYYSCVPYLMGPGQAMQFSFWPMSKVPLKIPRLPRRPPDNYLRDNMALTLDNMDVEFEMRVQLQTDPFLMPIENNAVLWPVRLSPRIPVATLKIPRQKFDDAQHLNLPRNLKFNPWHCLPEHRPLGNQSRARKRMYDELAIFRQKMNAENSSAGAKICGSTTGRASATALSASSSAAAASPRASRITARKRYALEA